MTRDPGPVTADRILDDLEGLVLRPADVARQARRLRAHIQTLREAKEEGKPMKSQTVIHYDLSDGQHGAFYRAACAATPKADGSNLSVADNQVTCKRCLKLMGYAVELEPVE